MQDNQTNTCQSEIIHSDHNGVSVEAFGEHSRDGTYVPAGHFYAVNAGSNQHSIAFQNGAVKLVGVNGLTNESLLAILIHRTEKLDAAFPSEDNKAAIASMKQALESFNKRTANRLARGVEGQNKL